MVGCKFSTALLLFIPIVSAGLIFNTERLKKERSCSPNLNVRLFGELNPEFDLQCEKNEMVIQFTKTANLEVKLTPPLCKASPPRSLGFNVEGCEWFKAEYNPKDYQWNIQVGHVVKTLDSIELNVFIDGNFVVLNSRLFESNSCFLRTFHADERSSLEILTPPAPGDVDCPFKLKFKRSINIAPLAVTQQNVEVVYGIYLLIVVIVYFMFAFVLLASLSTFVYRRPEY
ncbi:unnamed protein product [Bursaphelenchus xylophilus]|uniref:(pine wood nematode) hypothetical protein n=1 Tax=Bursaphelenchus xylophilus TaxID=6326 RepID=A0A1I7S4S8_BURXY|nr:unnamed protein product [Bursaphelenchus xylophilus]CAG9117350.1 unnamed protein product [Bursaphelenchus xylophilus]